MKEDFLHYLWQYQQFDKSDLQSVDGQSIQILKTGYKNKDQGPDFSNGRLVIDAIEWVGQIEIHIKSNEWHSHGHEQDPAYDNVILHVVWENNADVLRQDGTKIPTIELKNRVFRNTLTQYRRLLDNKSEIACAELFNSTNHIHKLAMLDKAMVHRLESKSKNILKLLSQSNGNWEEVAFKVLAQNFGFKLNSEAFLHLAEIVPLKILQKHRGNITQIEAIIFGAAGFLDNNQGEYAEKLSEEFKFLAQKYNISAMNKMQWKFSKTRIGNFPTIRLSQFAALINNIDSIFSFFITETNRVTILKQLQVLPSDYWQRHYDFNKTSLQNLRGMGTSSAENVIINSQVNLLAAYGQAIDNQEFLDKSFAILEQLKPESNRITNYWNQLEMQAKTAFDSQALIEQYNSFCSKKKCVECAVGAVLLKA